MAQTEQAVARPGAGFAERYVEAEGFRVRYLEAGQGPTLVHFHGAGGVRLTGGHDRLAERFRVLAVEVPGFGASVNKTSRSTPELALSLAGVIRALGVDRYSLWGTSFGGRLALWLALQAPEGIDALVLEAPAAIVPEGSRPPAGTPEERMRLLFAHPERQPPPPPEDPEVRARQQALLRRIGSPTREETEARLPELAVPTLVLFGTEDRVIPPEMGRVYREKVPSCSYLLVYDAGHEVAADRPEAFAAVVADFLTHREQFIVSQASGLKYP